jgi:dipeptidyl aminopeptidase/acylaminoacyl peptidase
MKRHRTGLIISSNPVNQYHMKTIYHLVVSVSMICFISCNRSDYKSREVKDYSVEQFMTNINMFGGNFSSNDSTILISSDKTGIYNIYAIPTAGGEAVALTHSDSTGLYSISYFPADNRVLFRCDNNGNEIYHIYVLNTDSTVVDLTPGKKIRSTFYEWNFDKESFVYGSNKRDERFMDVYEINIKTFTPKLLFKNDKGLDFGGISRDKNYMVFTKSLTSSNDEMYLYNVKNRKLKHISEHRGDANYSASEFGHDSKSLYYTTNENNEFTYLVKYDIEKEAKETIWYSYQSYNNKYRVTGINEDARTVIKIMDNSGRNIILPTLLRGDITNVNISKSELYMTLWIGSSGSPNDLYIYNFATGNATLLASAQNPEIDVNDLAEGEVIRYPSFDGLEIPALLYTPHQVSTKKKAPALVWVHGGPGGQSRLSYSALLQFLVNKGYVILAVNNRGSSGYGKTFYRLDDRNHGEGDLTDCIYARDYLASLGYVDTSKIGIIGGSYGGFMVMAALTLKPESFAVGVDLYGVTNWIRTLKNIPPWWESYRDALYDEMGDPVKDSIRLYRISPLFHADRIRKPFIVLQGANDPRVLQSESDEIVKAAKKNGIDVEYVLFNDEGHGFNKKENRVVAYKHILVFLNKYLNSDKSISQEGKK